MSLPIPQERNDFQTLEIKHGVGAKGKFPLFVLFSTLNAGDNMCFLFLYSKPSKWFYDTFTGAATGAARCGSFIGGAQIARGVGYLGIRWTRRFTWFGPPERNTLRPRVNVVVLLCLSARLRSSLFSLCQPVCVVRPLWLSSARTFYSPRPGSYSEAPWPDRWPRGW
jgi:hypothetical protein